MELPKLGAHRRCAERNPEKYRIASKRKGQPTIWRDLQMTRRQATGFAAALDALAAERYLIATGLWPPAVAAPFRYFAPGATDGRSLSILAQEAFPGRKLTGAWFVLLDLGKELLIALPANGDRREAEEMLEGVALALKQFFPRAIEWKRIEGSDNRPYDCRIDGRMAVSCRAVTR